MKALGHDTMQKKSLVYRRIRNSAPFHLDVDNVLGPAMSHVAAEKCTGPWKEPVFNSFCSDAENKIISQRTVVSSIGVRSTSLRRTFGFVYTISLLESAD